MAICGVLNALPASLTELEVAVDAWHSKLMGDVRRFSQLRDLRLLPNVAWMEKEDWAHFAAVARKVTALRLEHGICTVPDALPERLAAATRLQTLTLSAEWDAGLDAACRALQALANLE